MNKRALFHLSEEAVGRRPDLLSEGLRPKAEGPSVVFKGPEAEGRRADLLVEVRGHRPKARFVFGYPKYNTGFLNTYLRAECCFKGPEAEGRSAECYFRGPEAEGRRADLLVEGRRPDLFFEGRGCYKYIVNFSA